MCSKNFSWSPAIKWFAANRHKNFLKHLHHAWFDKNQPSENLENIVGKSLRMSSQGKRAEISWIPVGIQLGICLGRVRWVTNAFIVLPPQKRTKLASSADAALASTLLKEDLRLKT